MSLRKVRKQVHRRNYSEEFKREAVSSYEASGKSRSEICRLLDISSGSLLKNWSMLYSEKKRPRKSRIVMIKDPKNSPISEAMNEHAAPSEATRICELEAEVKRLKQALGNHAVKDYLAELREESWR
jgi:transposase-like protein